MAEIPLPWHTLRLACMTKIVKLSLFKIGACGQHVWGFANYLNVWQPFETVMPHVFHFLSAPGLLYGRYPTIHLVILLVLGNTFGSCKVIIPPTVAVLKNYGTLEGSG